MDIFLPFSLSVYQCVYGSVLWRMCTPAAVVVMVDVHTAVLLMFPAGEHEDVAAMRSVSAVCVCVCLEWGGEEEHTLTVASPELYTHGNIKEPLRARPHRCSLLPAPGPDTTTALSTRSFCTTETSNLIKTCYTTTRVHF